MQRWLLVRPIVGSLCAALTCDRYVAGHFSVFPDLVSLIAPPFLVALSLRLLTPRAQRWSRPVMRRAGWILVVSGAIFFALGHALMVRAISRFPSDVAFGMGIVGYMVMGGL